LAKVSPRPQLSGKEASLAEPSARKRNLKIVGLFLGVMVTVGLGSTAFFDWRLDGYSLSLTPRFSPNEFGASLRGNLAWLLLFVALSASMLPLRALQWQRTLERPVPFLERWHLVNLGAAVHNMLPGNMGDVTRAFLLARTQRLPFLVGLGSVAVCKLLELAALILMAAAVLMLPLWGALPEVGMVLRAAVWTCAGLVLLMILVARYAHRIAGRLPRRGRWIRLAALLGELNDGLGTARSARGMAVALLYSFPANLAAALAYGIGLQALGVHNGLLAGPLVLTLIAVGKGAPGLPTGPGMYFLVTAWIARALGASPSDAAAYALLTNIATGVSHWVPGLISLAVRRLRFSELKAQSGLAVQAANQAKRPARPLERHA
jgi:glycosyltransferase 2 family protein